MTDVIIGIVDECRSYWYEVGISRSEVDDMSNELADHLREAVNHGESPTKVIGNDLPTFATDWAREHRSEHARPLPSWDAVQSRIETKPATQQFKWAIAIAVIGVILTAIITSGEESIVDNEVWRWVWTIFALVMGIGEIFSAGFFLLPFGIGAGFAAAAAWLDLNGAVQWVAFFGGTAASMLYLRRFMRLQDTDEGLLIGPSRYVGMTATVVEAVDMGANTGRIRVEAEEWRAITDGDAIVEGTVVEVVELRGTRLVVSEVK